MNISLNISGDIPNLPGMQVNKDSWLQRNSDGFKKVKSGSRPTTASASRPQTAGSTSGSRTRDKYNFAASGSQKELVRPASASNLRSSASRGNQNEPMTPIMRATISRPTTALARARSCNEVPDNIYGAAIGTLGFEEERVPVRLSTPASPIKTGDVPAFVEQDKIICRVYGHFTTRRPWDNGPLGVPLAEESMVRHLVIHFYVAEQLVEMSERKAPNSGMSGGAFCKKRRLKKIDGSAVVLEDLAPGNTLQVLGHDIYITDADTFTRDYFRRELNMQLPPMLSRPAPVTFTNGAQYATGLFSKTMNTASSSEFPETAGMSQKRSTDYFVKKEQLDKTNRFLKYDGQVLRFQCLELPPKVANALGVASSPSNTMSSTNLRPQTYDRSSYKMRGDEKLFGLLFYLCDSSMEVRGIKGSDSSARCVVKRGKVPKNWREVQTGHSPIYYEPLDLLCGNIIDIYGKVMLISNCNAYTRTIYSDLDIDLSPIELVRAVEHKVDHPVPVQGDGFLNIGSNADTLATCYGSQKIGKDNSKLQRNQNRTLRCKLKALTQSATRIFMLTYYLEDDTLQIYEEVVRNSGHNGGNFLKRGKYQNHLPDVSYTGAHKHDIGIREFNSNDIYLGNIISVNGMEMQITEIDNLSLRFCESYPKEFPMFDPNKVVEKLTRNTIVGNKIDLRALIASRYDMEEKGYLDKTKFLAALDAANILPTLNEQEILTIFRCYRYNPSVPATGLPSSNVEYIYMYHELCDLISYYAVADGFGADSSQYGVRPTRDALDGLLSTLRLRTTTWRRALKRNDCSAVGNYVTLANLLKLLVHKGVHIDNLMGPREKKLLVRYYGISGEEAKPILRKIRALEEETAKRLTGEAKKKSLAVRAPKKVDAATIRHRREQLFK